MERKVGERRAHRDTAGVKSAWRHKRHHGRRVSRLPSLECQSVLQSLKEEEKDKQMRSQGKDEQLREKPEARLPTISASVSARESRLEVASSDAESPSFGALLNKVCTTRLHGDITDQNGTTCHPKKRTLRAGDRLQNAMEVVEIVRYNYHDDDDPHFLYDDDEEDEEEAAMARAVQASCAERCQAWLLTQIHTPHLASSHR